MIKTETFYIYTKRFAVSIIQCNNVLKYVLDAPDKIPYNDARNWHLSLFEA